MSRDRPNNVAPWAPSNIYFLFLKLDIEDARFLLELVEPGTRVHDDLSEFVERSAQGQESAV